MFSWFLYAYVARHIGCMHDTMLCVLILRGDEYIANRKYKLCRLNNTSYFLFCYNQVLITGMTLEEVPNTCICVYTQVCMFINKYYTHKSNTNLLKCSSFQYTLRYIDTCSHSLDQYRFHHFHMSQENNQLYLFHSYYQ